MAGADEGLRRTGCGVLEKRIFIERQKRMRIDIPILFLQILVCEIFAVGIRR